MSALMMKMQNIYILEVLSRKCKIRCYCIDLTRLKMLFFVLSELGRHLSWPVVLTIVNEVVLEMVVVNLVAIVVVSKVKVVAILEVIVVVLVGSNLVAAINSNVVAILSIMIILTEDLVQWF